MKTDTQLKHDVIAELKWDARIHEPGIGVIVKDAVAILTGTVDTLAEKVAAEKAAKRVNGIKAVAQEIEVRLSGDHKRTDQEIAQIALSCLSWDTLVPKNHVFVKVENGWITLEGKVDWNYQKEACENTLQNLSGVRGINNLIEINSPIKPQTVQENIKKVFERNAIIDANKIKIEVNQHKVILSGTVQSWDEEKQACEAAWSSPGVWQVENKLVVKPRESEDLLKQ